MGLLTRSTTIDTDQFIAECWASRLAMSPSARHGLAQCALLSFSAHIEAVLAERISKRLKSIHRILAKNEFADEPWTLNDVPKTIAAKPLADSVKRLAEKQDKTLQKAPYERLKELFDLVFASVTSSGRHVPTSPRRRTEPTDNSRSEELWLVAFRCLVNNGSNV